MKERTSKEIRDELKTNHAGTREIYSQIEKAKAKMLQTVAGGDEWLTLDDLCKELKKQLPGLAEKKYTLTRELFGAVTRERAEQRTYNERIRGELTPKVKALIGEINDTLKQYQGRLEALSEAYVPKGSSPQEFSLSVQIAIEPRDFSPFENTMALLEAPAQQKLTSLNSEWHQLRDQLAQAAR